jgi:hypothetical protein
LHIWKEHVEIDQITNFHEKIIWQSLLYRIPLTIDPDAQVCVDQNDEFRQIFKIRIFIAVKKISQFQNGKR